jgi:Kef-type K+ transport system membrane component KefB
MHPNFLTPISLIISALGFTEHIFPQASRPYLSLVAEIGLCLFLFLVGLEIDGSVYVLPPSGG